MSHPRLSRTGSMADPLVGRVPESIAIALGHQRRLRILVALLGGPGSATSLSRGQLMDLAVDDADYHLKKLESAGAVAHLKSEKVRGATMHTYELSEAWRPLVRQVACLGPATET